MSLTIFVIAWAAVGLYIRFAFSMIFLRGAA